VVDMHRNGIWETDMQEVSREPFRTGEIIFPSTLSFHIQAGGIMHG